jgi:hypothetical protein
MDFYHAIRELLEEKKRLDRLIAALEAIQNGELEEKPSGVRHRRGRKAMSDDERREVSARMKRYWATRRNSANGEAQSIVTS